MKIVDIFSISGRGHGIITDEPFTPSSFASARGKTKFRIVGTGDVVEWPVMSVEAALKTGGNEFLALLVPFIDDDSVRESLLHRDIELE